MSHANAQHRAASDPGEGHAVKAGEGKARALLVDDGKAELAGSCSGLIVLHDAICRLDYGFRARLNVTAGLIKVARDSEGNTVSAGRF